jgi:hypothetical protein
MNAVFRNDEGTIVLLQPFLSNLSKDNLNLLIDQLLNERKERSKAKAFKAPAQTFESYLKINIIENYNSLKPNQIHKQQVYIDIFLKHPFGYLNQSKFIICYVIKCSCLPHL